MSTVVFGGGAGFIPEWERMWDTIRGFEPRALLLPGDNVYIDDPEHRLTQQYCYYRRQSRPEWRRLVSSTAVFSIWDDHDFGTNDCVPGPQVDEPGMEARGLENLPAELGQPGLRQRRRGSRLLV